MGDICDKFLSHLINLGLLVNVVLELSVRILKRSNCILEPTREVVHIASENSDLILSIRLIVGVKVEI